MAVKKLCGTLALNIEGASDMGHWDQLFATNIKRSHKTKLRDIKLECELSALALLKDRKSIRAAEVESALQCSNVKAKSILNSLVTKGKLVRNETFERRGGITRSVVSYTLP